MKILLTFVIASSIFIVVFLLFVFISDENSTALKTDNLRKKHEFSDMYTPLFTLQSEFNTK